MTITAQSDMKPPDNMFKHLQTSASTFRLNQIEKIRANGVGDLVALPQLAVCGDQSTGKSSVLEAITGIPFPREEGLCTRFPTEIILRHSETLDSPNLAASIRPHASRGQDERRTLSAYRKTVQNMSELPSIIDEVSRLLQLRGYTDNHEGQAFAADSLRIEITGPIGLHLSIVDLPGLISVPNEEQTQEDVDSVHDMVRTYLESSRTIILAVLQAGNDMANQPIIKLARQYDPDGERTVGIITKPDLINAGAEAKLALVAKNQDVIKLKLGFFLLKNPTPLELKDGIDMETRAIRELRFFSTPVWARQGLDQNRLGAEKLRFYLQELLDAHIERELPKVGEEIRKRLSVYELELKSLGQARPTLGQIRAFLTSLSMKFYELSQAALDGNYHSADAEFFSANDACRLRAQIQAANTKFATCMREDGQRRKVGSPTSACESETAQLTVSQEEMMDWVKQAYFRTRGRELPGNYNSALLAELFQEQSQRWRHLSQSHISEVMKITSKWVRQATQRLITEAKLRRDIGSTLNTWLDNAENLAVEELDKLIDDERRVPLTYNHYYTDNVQKDRLKNQRVAVREAIDVVTQRDWNGKLHISNQSEDINRFVSAIESRITVDMDEQACKEALIQLQAYYKVAMKTFIDNVARQVIERHLMTPLSRAFCPNSVSLLSDEELVRIGSETEQQIRRRDSLLQISSSLRSSLADLEKLPN